MIPSCAEELDAINEYVHERITKNAEFTFVFQEPRLSRVTLFISDYIEIKQKEEYQNLIIGITIYFKDTFGGKHA